MKYNRCMDTSEKTMAFSNDSSCMNMDMGMGMMPPMMDTGCCCPTQPMMCPPIYECPQVRCCHRVINYEVPQV